MRALKVPTAETQSSLYSDIALLVAESRVAGGGEEGGGGGGGGWRSGPHCPPVAIRPKLLSPGHACSSASPACVGASKLRRVGWELGRRGLPLSLEVLAVPPTCPAAEACPRATVLELWRLESIGRTREARKPPLPAQFLLQALSSHLHFSQLSAWLTQGNGKLPFRIAHRALLHGEESEIGRRDSECYAGLKVHDFPESATEAHIIKVRAWSLPRSETATIPSLSCSCGDGKSPPSPEHLFAPLRLPPTPELPPPPPSPPPAPSEEPPPKPRRREPAILLSHPAASTSTAEDGADLSGDDERTDGRGEELRHPSPEGATGLHWRKSSFTAGETSSARMTLPPHHQRARNRAFNALTGLPLHSSPAPLKRKPSVSNGDSAESDHFGFDPLLRTVKGIQAPLKRKPSVSNGDTGESDHFGFDPLLRTVKGIQEALRSEDADSSDSESGSALCKSAPASTSLLGNFEESALNGRLKPFGSLSDFRLDLAASGAFCPPHISLPVATFFFRVSEDDAPSPYLGHCSLEAIGKKGYHIPKRGTVQATLFNPQGTVVKMFVVRYDLSSMPPAHTTFLRQRTFFMPSRAGLAEAQKNKAWLRYLIHLRLATSRAGKLYLHSDIRSLFSRKSDLGADDDDGGYELRSFTEMPANPRFSPRRFPRTPPVSAGAEMVG